MEDRLALSKFVRMGPWRTTLLRSLALAFACLPIVLFAQSPSARWISASGATASTTGVYSFRKIFSLTMVPGTFPVHVSADNRFILYVNGRRMGEGPARGDLKHWRYETFDLAPVLQPGENVVAARVWSFGEQAPVAQIFSQPGFILWPDLPAAVNIGTDETWDVREEPGWTIAPTGPPVSSVPGPDEVLDASKYDWGWNQLPRISPTKESISWSYSVLVPQPGWTLVPDQLPPMENIDLPAGRVVRTSDSSMQQFPAEPVTLGAHSRVTLLLDRGTLTTAYPELTVTGGRGSRVRLTYAEALYDDRGAKGNRNDIAGKHMDLRLIHDEFLPDGGTGRMFRPLWWRTWRYLQIDVETESEPLRLESVKAEFTAYPFVEMAQLRASDPVLSQIWDVGWRTLRLDAHETYMDCPYWEQLQYVGDTRIEALVSYAMSGDDRLARQALRSFADSTVAPGLTESRYPTRSQQVIPPFSLLWIGMLHDFWWYRPEGAAIAKELLPVTRTVLDYFVSHQRPDGLLGRLPEQGYELWNFLDWSKASFVRGVPLEDPDGGSVPLTLQFAGALRDAADLEDATGDSMRAAHYREAASRIVAAVYREAWVESRGLLADTPARTAFSQQSNILGVLTDAIPAAKQKVVLQNILADELAGKAGNLASALASPTIAPASYYFRFYLARAIDHAGLDDLYLQLLGPWRGMLQLGLSTWAEEPEPARSDAHAWSSHPNYDLLTLVAGISPAEPGFRTIRISPHLGSLSSLTATMPHPDGMIQVWYRRLSGSVTAQVTLPSGVNGTLEWDGKLISLHGGAQTFDLPVLRSLLGGADNYR